MTIPIQGPGAAVRDFSGIAGSAAAGAAAGEWNGLAVSAAEDPSSLLADAMEEMTFAASETVEKDVSDRKKPEKERRVARVVPPTGAVADLRKRMEERLAELLGKIRAGRGNPAAFREALSGFPDPAERHAALAWLEERLADAPSLAALAKREREALEAEAPEAIQAGYNLSGVDPGPLGGPAEAGGVYRRAILGHGGVSAMLEEILSRSGEADFVETVEFLRRAVGADLSAANPSTDPRELAAMNNDLYHLRALGNFTREFGEELGGLRAEGGKPPLPGAGLEVLRLFCRAKDERLVRLDGLAHGLALEGERDPTYDVRALTLAHRLAHRMPAKLFAGEDSRQRLLDAGQKLLDAAIDLEDSLAAGEE